MLETLLRKTDKKHIFVSFIIHSGHQRGALQKSWTRSYLRFSCDTDIDCKSLHKSLGIIWSGSYFGGSPSRNCQITSIF